MSPLPFSSVSRSVLFLPLFFFFFFSLTSVDVFGPCCSSLSLSYICHSCFFSMHSLFFFPLPLSLSHLPPPSVCVSLHAALQSVACHIDAQSCFHVSTQGNMQRVSQHVACCKRRETTRENKHSRNDSNEKKKFIFKNESLE